MNYKTGAGKSKKYKKHYTKKHYSKKHYTKKHYTKKHHGGSLSPNDVKSSTNMLINNCPGIPNGGLSCGISRGGSRKARKSRSYKGGNFTCPYPVPERLSGILGPLACNISRGGSIKHAIRH